MDGQEVQNINNENWWETLDGFLWKLEQLRDENIRLKEELNELKEKEIRRGDLGTTND